MPRQARIEYEGAIYHVMNRGDRREDIVRGDEGKGVRRIFLQDQRDLRSKEKGRMLRQVRIEFEGATINVSQLTVPF